MGDSLSVARSCHVTRAIVTVLLVYAPAGVAVSYDYETIRLG